MRKALLLGLILAASAGPALAQASPGVSPSPDPAALMRQAAQVQGEAMRGVVACRVVTETSIRSSLFNREVRVEIWQLSQDGIPQRAILLSMQRDGGPASAEEKAEREEKINAAFKEGKRRFDGPYEARSAADYRLQAVEGRAVRFTSRLRDERHGDGVAYFGADGQLQRVKYAPAKVEGNSEGEVEIFFRGVGPAKALAPSRMKLSFSGSRGPISGTMTSTVTMDRYQRFASMAAAVEKLALARP